MDRKEMIQGVSAYITRVILINIITVVTFLALINIIALKYILFALGVYIGLSAQEALAIVSERTKEKEKEKEFSEPLLAIDKIILFYLFTLRAIFTFYPYRAVIGPYILFREYQKTQNKRSKNGR